MLSLPPKTQKGIFSFEFVFQRFSQVRSDRRCVGFGRIELGGNGHGSHLIEAIDFRVPLRDFDLGKFGDGPFDSVGSSHTKILEISKRSAFFDRVPYHELDLMAISLKPHDFSPIIGTADRFAEVILANPNRFGPILDRELKLGFTRVRIVSDVVDAIVSGKFRFGFLDSSLELLQSFSRSKYLDPAACHQDQYWPLGN